MWEQLIGTTGELTTMHLYMRAITIFSFGLLLVRLGRRRAVMRWSALDVILSIIVGSNLSRALTGGAPLIATLIATTILVLVLFMLAHAAVRSAILSRFLENTLVDLARDGAECPGALRRHAVSAADLSEALWYADVEAISKTMRVTLETSGATTVLRRQ